MSKKLFEDFEGVTSKAWKQKIQVDLKGADYNDTLIWTTNEDINVKPFYHQDDLVAENPLPVTSNTWNICQTIFVADVKLSNKKAVNAIERGAESIAFIIPDNEVSITDLTKNIDISVIPLHFKLQFLDAIFVAKVYKLSSKNITVNTDIIGNLARSGNWFSGFEADFTALETIIKTNPSALSVDSGLYQNAGANNVQQLAYTLAHANEYLNAFGTTLSAPITFNVSVGTNYFFEIAKLRALRVLWKTIAKEYGANTDCFIFVTPTKRNKTIYDYNINMLRTTTECMSAILGGANTICNLAYDAIYHKDNEFGERIARNQLLILKHESYFDAVENASDGSYYIENLTTQLAEKALTLFKSIENKDGFLHLLKSGTIQKKIKENAQKEVEQFNNKSLILLGTNKHPNPEDKMKNDLELYPFLKMNTRKTLIEPILEKRIAEAAEQNRLNQE
ncbi:methylmalonyl-CoA mutase [Bizionia gelidisalsuginis]|uniref:Methylmalonyl-CoA mutase n=2 Tax=Bizionia TaxID=283785 RepID=A0A8H2LCC2_9FLAO|nr:MULTISPECIES: methylmalonyl-CoA mutase subunit beta [Bizionia]TYB70521.1 methylmalonyl-CoA mutase [Bizionia saleffrena]TYC10669.1 methylmalonyl-CoA mutase [Bizionia gelidisalsuginis]